MSVERDFSSEKVRCALSVSLCFSWVITVAFEAHFLLSFRIRSGPPDGSSAWLQGESVSSAVLGTHLSV